MPDLKDDVIIEILKYKPIKYLIVCLLVIVVAVISYAGINHIYRCHNGLNSKFLWGASECIECKIESVRTIRDTIFRDTCQNKEPKIIFKRVPSKVEKETVNANDKSHVVAGHNNTVGVNGDLNINTERELTQNDRIEVMNLIHRLEKNDSIDIKCIGIVLTVESNGKKYASQLSEFLDSQGYPNGIGTGAFSKPMHNVSYQLMPSLNGHKKCPQFIVGVFN